jgi:hypothetical protein
MEVYRFVAMPKFKSLGGLAGDIAADCPIERSSGVSDQQTSSSVGGVMRGETRSKGPVHERDDHVITYRQMVSL